MGSAGHDQHGSVVGHEHQAAGEGADLAAHGGRRLSGGAGRGRSLAYLGSGAISSRATATAAVLLWGASPVASPELWYHRTAVNTATP